MPFGPGDLLYETYGDRRGFLVAPAVGLMQLMYPDLGRGGGAALRLLRRTARAPLPVGPACGRTFEP